MNFLYYLCSMKTYHRIVSDLRQVYPEGEARALARWLCEERFGLTQTDLLLDKDNELSADDIEVVKEITSRLLNHEPIQYILGHTDFCGRRFSTAPGALIPRPETEQLVLRLLADLPEAAHAAPSGSALRVLDIGTGTGCIALTLALELPASRVTAWDVSPEALDVARRNASLYPEATLSLEQVDIFSPPDDNRQWDLIVSNPPYVCQTESRDMARNVLDHEPHLALFVPDDDPLRYYRAIALYARRHLRPGGTLWVEINQQLGAETAHLIGDICYLGVDVLDDDFGRPRFVRAR